MINMVRLTLNNRVNMKKQRPPKAYKANVHQMAEFYDDFQHHMVELTRKMDTILSSQLQSGIQEPDISKETKSILRASSAAQLRDMMDVGDRIVDQVRTSIHSAVSTIEKRVKLAIGEQLGHDRAKMLEMYVDINEHLNLILDCSEAQRDYVIRQLKEEVKEFIANIADSPLANKLNVLEGIVEALARDSIDPDRILQLETDLSSVARILHMTDREAENLLRDLKNIHRRSLNRKVTSVASQPSSDAASITSLPLSTRVSDCNDDGSCEDRDRLSENGQSHEDGEIYSYALEGVFNRCSASSSEEIVLYRDFKESMVKVIRTILNKAKQTEKVLSRPPSIVSSRPSSLLSADYDSHRSNKTQHGYDDVYQCELNNTATTTTSLTTNASPTTTASPTTNASPTTTTSPTTNASPTSTTSPTTTASASTTASPTTTTSPIATTSPTTTASPTTTTSPIATTSPTTTASASTSKEEVTVSKDAGNEETIYNSCIPREYRDDDNVYDTLRFPHCPDYEPVLTTKPQPDAAKTKVEPDNTGDEEKYVYADYRDCSKLMVPKPDKSVATGPEYYPLDSTSIDSDSDSHYEEMTAPQYEELTAPQLVSDDGDEELKKNLVMVGPSSDNTTAITSRSSRCRSPSNNQPRTKPKARPRPRPRSTPPPSCTSRPRPILKTSNTKPATTAKHEDDGQKKIEFDTASSRTPEKEPKPAKLFSLSRPQSWTLAFDGVPVGQRQTQLAFSSSSNL